MSHEQKNELLKKRREARQQKKVMANLIDVEHYGRMGLEQFVQEKLQSMSEQIAQEVQMMSREEIKGDWHTVPITRV